ncbi:MAG: ABC transporter permease [Phycisphaerales bacterium]
MFSVALKMLLGDRGKYLSLVMGLAFAVLLITQQGSIFLGLMLRATGPLQNISQADLWVTDPHVKWVSETRNLSDADLNRVRSVPGVAWAEPFFNIRAVAELPGGNFRSVNIVGISRSTMVGRPPEMLEGRLEDLRIADAVIVEDSARGKLEDPQIGTVLKLNDRRAVVVGFARAKAGFDSPAIVFTTYPNAVNFVPLGRNKLSYVLVGVKDGVDRREVQARINRVPGLAALTPDEMRWRTVRFIMAETGIGINFGITVLLGFIVGLVVSAAIFYQFTVDNLRNFAVLKAMGARRATLIGMILLQAVVVGVVGFGIGVGGAGLFSLAGRKPGAELAVYFPWQLMFVALFAMVACVSLGSLLSLSRVLRLEPAVVFK